MGDFASLRPSVRLYVGVVVLVGLSALAQSIHRLYLEPIGAQWFILAGLTLLTGSFTVKVPSINAHISVSETFVFASVLLFGPAAGAITVLLECLIINFWIKHGRPAHRVLFNITAPAVAIWVSGHVFFLVAGIEPFSRQSTPLPGLFIPLLLFTILYFVLNSALVAVALGLEMGMSPLHIWWNNFIWLSVNYFSGASVAALIVTYTKQIDLSTLAIILPLLVVSYLTFRTAMGRVEDSNKHLASLNKLYLSTIETLAMAIDAKDQITHGHIRRVQSYAVHLAKHLGVTDERLIRAVEASALLHDMGKLAVPEYILNKPGKLTEAEFAIMKLHASAGADILSAIEFPYPVIPIVRHHHENWDGTGYPDGLKGTEIPIGARILAVVDCFDALTSDRPYRPRLGDSEALEILKTRRGAMYDPLVVDAFFAIHSSIRSSEEDAAPFQGSVDSAEQIQAVRSAAGLHRFDGISHGTDEMLALFDLTRELAGKGNLMLAGETLIKHLKRLIPFSVAVLYVFDDLRNELVARYASGDHAGLTSELRIAVGHHLSGWVAANRRTVVNSDASLDFGCVANSFSPPLKSSLSSPIVFTNKLLGVLTLYSNQVPGFSETHRRVIDAFIEHTAKVVSSDLTASTRSLESLTAVLDGPELEQFLLRVTKEERFLSSSVLLFVDVSNALSLSDTSGSMHAEILDRMASTFRGHLRDSDVLVLCRPSQFVALLANVGLVQASEKAEKISTHIKESLRTKSDEPFKIGTSLVHITDSNVVAAVREIVMRADPRSKTTHLGAHFQVH